MTPAEIASVLADLATRHGDLAAAWDRIARQTREDRVAAAVAAMEAQAAKLARQLGRPDGYVYRGGPVPWEGK